MSIEEADQDDDYYRRAFIAIPRETMTKLDLYQSDHNCQEFLDHILKTINQLQIFIASN